jgi:NAD(P)-dependent dehydrogenase (short-subunit alcohol dehydrogenase family)
VITGSGAAYLPGSRQTAYSSSKAAVVRCGEAQRIHEILERDLNAIRLHREP